MAEEEDETLLKENLKRMRQERPQLYDVLRIARRMWQKNADIARSTGSEDRDFRESYGCCPQVALNLWSLLTTLDYVPVGGRLEHLLWMLNFLKAYGKTRANCTACGGVDPETHRIWVWSFVRAVALLEPHVVCFDLTQCH